MQEKNSYLTYQRDVLKTHLDGLSNIYNVPQLTSVYIVSESIAGEERDTCAQKELKDLNVSELKLRITPFFRRNGILKTHLAVFDKEKIDGSVFVSEFSFPEDRWPIDQLFKDMPFGDRCKFKKIVHEIFSKEELRIRFKYSNQGNVPRRFAEKTRMRFDFYTKGSVFENQDFSESDLITPIHIFRHRNVLDDFSLPKWIAMEAAKFAGACLTNRKNGTIHFGVSQIADSNKGEIVGLPIDIQELMEIFYDEIKKWFYKDQINVVLKCLRPPQLVRVKEITRKENPPLYVVEIDVVPTYGITHYDTFYVKDAESDGDSVAKIYTFCKNELTVLQKDELKKYMVEKIHIAKKRKTVDFSVESIEHDSYNAHYISEPIHLPRYRNNHDFLY